MKVLSLNARSIVNKISELEIIVTEMDPDIIIIVETWLDNQIGRPYLGLPAYSVFRKDRANGNEPHGVLIAIKTHLNPMSAVNSKNSMEVLSVDLLRESRVIRIVSAYRPGWYDYAHNREFISEVSRHCSNHDSVFIFGDFNFPGINWDLYISASEIENIFVHFILENNLVQHVKTPTRENNILDLCLSVENAVKSILVHECFSTSDHSYITCDLVIQNFSSNSQRDRLMYDFK